MLAVLLLLLAIAPRAIADDATIERHLATIARVGTQGQGSAEARGAADALAAIGIEALPKLLVAMDTPNIVVANWYRSIYETIVGGSWPVRPRGCRAISSSRTPPTPVARDALGGWCWRSSIESSRNSAASFCPSSWTIRSFAPTPSIWLWRREKRRSPRETRPRR
jgi:hypothetical protein